MTFDASINISISGADDFERASKMLFEVKNFLKATLGTWTHKRSGTGNGGSVDTSGVDGNDLWTSAAAIDGYGAWWNGVETVSGVEILISMRASAGAEENLGFAWSRSAGFSGGSPTETVLPTATDECLAADRTATDCTMNIADFNLHILGDDATPSFLAYAAEGVGDLRFVYGLDWLTDARAGDNTPGVAWCIGATAFDMSDLASATRPGAGYDVDDATIRNRIGANGFTLYEGRSDAASADPFTFLATADPRTGKVTQLEVPVICDVGPNAHLKGVSSYFRRVPNSLSLFDTTDSKARVVLKGGTGSSFTVQGDGATTPSP